MFHRFFGADDGAGGRSRPAAALTTVVDPAGETATVRRIVARLEAMPPEHARLVAAGGVHDRPAANADIDISDEETAGDRAGELQAHDRLDEPTAILVTEMAKLPGEDRRQHRGLRRHPRVQGTSPRCSSGSTSSGRASRSAAANGSISAEESAIVNEIAHELDIDAGRLNAVRADVPRAAVVGPGRPAGGRPDRLTRALTPRRSDAASCRSTRPSPSRRRTSARSSAS